MEHLSNGEACRHATPKRQSISLVLPAWNEAAAIRRAIAEADAALRDITNQYEIIVVDDGSDDKTAAYVGQIAAANPAVRLVRHDTNRGYGAALRSGFAAAKCDLVVFTDADSQFDLAELDRFVLLSRRYQVVCGYRIDRQDSALRCLYSHVYNQLVRCLLRTGVRDVDCALKMFHRDVLRELKVTTDGFLVNSELLTQARQRGRSIVEVGVSHRPRTEGQSTVSSGNIPAVLTGLLRYWWNHVQFPGGDPNGNDPTAPTGAVTSERNWIPWAQVLLVLFAAIFLLTGLAYPLLDRDETRYAEIPREMLATGNWVLPQLNFRPYYDKPALLYWLCATSYAIFGVSEWSARVVSAASGMGTLIVTMWFGNRVFGRRTGLLAGVVLLLSVGFLGTSRMLVIDGVLTFFTTISLFAAYEALRGERFHLGWWTIASVASGVAFLAKGPISLVLLIPPVFTFGWLTKGGSKPQPKHWLFLAGIVAAVVTPWFVAVSIQDPRFAYEFFYRHNVTRFAGAFHEQPMWYFVPILMIAGHPWTFLTIPYASFLASHSEEARRRRTPPIGFLLLWSAWCFAFFSIAKCKLPTYILPAAPALALMIGHYLEQDLFSSARGSFLGFARKWPPWLAAVTTCLVGMGFGVFALLNGLELPGIACATIAFWATLLPAMFLLRRKWTSVRVGWVACVASSLLLAGYVLHRELPRYAQAQTVFGPGSPLVAVLPPAA